MMSRSTHFRRKSRALSCIGALLAALSGGAAAVSSQATEGFVNAPVAVKQAPAGLPNRDALAGAWIVLYFSPAGENMTHVRIVGLGYNDTPAHRRSPGSLRMAIAGRSITSRSSIGRPARAARTRQ